VRRARRFVGPGGLALAALALFCARAAAQEEQVRLSIPDCEGASGAEIAKLVGLELAPGLATVLDDASPATLHATLRCADGRALITVVDPVRAQPLELNLSLVETRSEARARFLALAIAELIATSRLERASAHKPPPPDVVKPPDEAPDETPREVPLMFWLGAGVLRAFEPASWLPVLALGAADSFGRFALTGELNFAWGTQQQSEALIQMRIASLSLAPAVQWSAGRFAGHVAVGLRAGYAWLSATPRQAGFAGEHLSGVFIAPVVQGALQWRVSDAWRARLGLELGYVATPLRGLDADGAPLIELRGLFVAGLLGVVWAP
jgi:hypothetical protein